MVVVGIDEVGRGCWAGPLVAAAVILSAPLPEIKDSKRTSKLQRYKMARLIRSQAKSIGLGWVSSEQVDHLGLTKATAQAMQQALDNVNADYDCIIIDGNYNYLPDYPNVETLVKADDLIHEVSAASIIAKTERDKFMTRMSKRYPQYSFESHVGYGTAHHLKAIKTHGLCDLHRRSFQPIRDLARSANV